MPVVLPSGKVTKNKRSKTTVILRKSFFVLSWYLAVTNNIARSAGVFGWCWAFCTKGALCTKFDSLTYFSNKKLSQLKIHMHVEQKLVRKFVLLSRVVLKLSVVWGWKASITTVHSLHCKSIAAVWVPVSSDSVESWIGVAKSGIAGRGAVSRESVVKSVGAAVRGRERVTAVSGRSPVSTEVREGVGWDSVNAVAVAEGRAVSGADSLGVRRDEFVVGRRLAPLEAPWLLGALFPPDRRLRRVQRVTRDDRRWLHTRRRQS